MNLYVTVAVSSVQLPCHCQRVTCTNYRQHRLTLAGGLFVWHMLSHHCFLGFFRIFHHNGRANLQRAYLQIPAGRLQEKPGPLLIHISNSDELPDRLFLARHFDLLLRLLVRLHLRKQPTDGGSYPVWARDRNKRDLDKHSILRKKRLKIWIKLHL